MEALTLTLSPRERELYSIIGDFRNSLSLWERAGVRVYLKAVRL
jgi:hypothetical protein